MIEYEKAPGHPDVLRPTNEELVTLAQGVVDAIEQCGASPALTCAVGLAHDLKVYLQKPSESVDGLSFGFALDALKKGFRVARAGWNGRGMWLSLSCGETREVPAASFWSPHNRGHAEAQGGTAKVLPSITMKTATGEILMGWLASQTDMLAEDWQIV